jgi:prophage regulatory protein
MNILTIDQVAEKTTLCRRTIYNYEKAGRFPEKVKLGERCVGWVASEVDAWLRARAGERISAQREGVHA